MTTTPSELIAYDYTRQTWTTGWAAAHAMLNQIRDMRAVLDNPDYLAAVGLTTPDQHAEAVTAVDADELTALAVLGHAPRPAGGPRFYVISETRGLLWSGDDEDRADELGLIAAVNSGHTVHVHDRATEKG